MDVTYDDFILQNELQDMLNVQEGHIFDYQDIVDDRRKLEMYVAFVAFAINILCTLYW